ncbi:DUF397 domain-containing protein [Streptomyces sp. NPDC127197]|uniref:DUF397 domain-containing protein n=1 Tax=Streptomyces sp. NPDC127197 TaxID=3345388 RepID=UPI003636A913
MNETPTSDQFAAAGWFKSSYSAADNECVEVSHVVPAWVGIRDSKIPGRRGLAVSADAFAVFVEAIAQG